MVQTSISLALSDLGSHAITVTANLIARSATLNSTLSILHASSYKIDKERTEAGQVNETNILEIFEKYK